MDPLRCQVFIKMAQLGNLTKTAEELGYTQPAVSLMLKRLEEECGFKLFFRTSKGVSLTPDGSRMLPVMREIVKWDDICRQTADAVRGVETGTIRIGTYSSIGCYWLPKVIRRFRPDHPLIDIKIYESGVQQISDWIGDGFVDIGFLSKGPGQAFEQVVLKEDPILTVLPKGHPMADAEAVPLSALHDPSFILSVNSYDDDCYRVFEEYQRQYGDSLRVNISSSGAFLILSMVEQGLGISVLAEMMTQDYRDRLVVKKLQPPFKRTIIAGFRARDLLLPAAGKFLAYAEAFAKDPE